jgi:hypothetical protein
MSRKTRDRLIDLLEEAIKLVKIRCVDPEAENMLEKSRREFQEAVEMKREAAELLKTAQEVSEESYDQEEGVEVAEEGEELPQQEEESAQEAAEEAPQEAPEAPQVPQAPQEVPQAPQAPQESILPSPALQMPKNVTRKKLPSCPGGPKAFNEFLKAKRAEVEAQLGPNAKYPNVRAEIARRWKETCRTKTNTKKLFKTKTPKTLVTRGRVNAPSTLAPPPTPSTPSTPSTLLTPVQETPSA